MAPRAVGFRGAIDHFDCAPCSHRHTTKAPRLAPKNSGLIFCYLGDGAGFDEALRRHDLDHRIAQDRVERVVNARRRNQLRMFDHPRRYLYALPGVDTPAISVARRGTFETVQPATRIPVQGARPFADPADLLVGCDPARALADRAPSPHRLRRLPPRKDIMEIGIWAEAREIIGADGDLFEALSRKHAGHSAQLDQRVPCPDGQRCEIDAGGIADNAIDGSAHRLAGAISMHARASRRIVGQSCGCGNYLAAQDFGEDPNLLADVIEDMLLDTGTHSVG